MKITDKYVFFWGGIYSQWYQSDMIIDGVSYNCCEQYMMHQKALTFGDTEIAEKIMAISNSKEQKRLGRLVKGFDKSVWDSKAFSVVYKGNLAKFTQNPTLMSQLMTTGNRIIVEASPLDNIWGIGLHEDNEDCLDPSLWKGTNLLGFAITAVRNTLKEKDE
jgi:ribA/ribD-fused uncharacterized protein